MNGSGKCVHTHNGDLFSHKERRIPYGRKVNENNILSEVSQV
jgi:hypothetical protein